MKSIALISLMAALLFGTTDALAGGRGHGCGYGSCVGGYYPGYPGYKPYYPYRAHGGYYGYPQHKNNDNSNTAVIYGLGGLLLGSVLVNAYTRSQAAQPVYNQQTYSVAPPPAQGRRLVRDLNGNCYERITDANGNELRTELPPSACNW